MVSYILGTTTHKNEAPLQALLPSDSGREKDELGDLRLPRSKGVFEGPV